MGKNDHKAKSLSSTPIVALSVKKRTQDLSLRGEGRKVHLRLGFAFLPLSPTLYKRRTWQAFFFRRLVSPSGTSFGPAQVPLRAGIWRCSRRRGARENGCAWDERTRARVARCGQPGPCRCCSLGTRADHLRLFIFYTLDLLLV